MDETLFFPITGDPVGFNHFAAAEIVIRQIPALKRVVFIPSNGLHPDPTKQNALADKKSRLAWLEESISLCNNPATSHLAKQAQRAENPLIISPENLSVWDYEYGFNQPVPTAQTLAAIAEAHITPQNEKPGKGAIHWLAGTDLIQRMSEKNIFSDDELNTQATHCTYVILERAGASAQKALKHLEKIRGVALNALIISDIPPHLIPYLSLSSTHIRHGAEAGDPLGAMLPAPIAQKIVAGGIYNEGKTKWILCDSGKTEQGRISTLEAETRALQHKLDEAGKEISDWLKEAATKEQPHTLSLAEATVGGVLTSALAGRTGASTFFKQARFAYDKVAKETLIGPIQAGESAVSETMVQQMAEAMNAQSQTHYALAESGMAGPPDGKRRSMKSGICHFALATPKGTHTSVIEANPFLTRKEHQLLFSIGILTQTLQWLKEG